MQPRYYHQVVGINSRLDTLQAAVLLVKLPHLDRWTAATSGQRRALRRAVRRARLDRVLGCRRSSPAAVTCGTNTSFACRTAAATLCATTCTQVKVGTEIYYPVPLHEQQCFRSLGYGPGSLPQSETSRPGNDRPADFPRADRGGAADRGEPDRRVLRCPPDRQEDTRRPELFEAAHRPRQRRGRLRQPATNRPLLSQLARR